MAKTKDDQTPTTAIATQPNLSIMPADMESLARTLIAEDFAEERTFGIGDPQKGKTPIYLGELIGPGGSVMVEPPGAKPDPTTGEVKMSELPVWLFHPIDASTMKPFTQRVDSIICSHAVNNICAKYHTLAQAQQGVAQILLRWNGTIQTRKGNQLNDVQSMHRIVKRQ